MANLWITEYDKVGLAVAMGGALGEVPLPQEPAVAGENISFTTATASAAFNAATRVVRLLADADCHVLFGAAPVADADDQKLIAGVEYWRAVVAGQKVSVYDGSS